MLIELLAVGLVIPTDLSGGQATSSWSGEESRCGSTGGGGRGSRHLPKQAGLEHCDGWGVYIG